jgi:hypothetical protein
MSRSEIDLKLYIESFFIKKRRGMMAISHKQVVVIHEPESVTLVQEYEHLPEFIELLTHGDKRPLVRLLTRIDAESLEDRPHDHPQESVTSDERCLSNYYSAQSLEPGGAIATQQKPTPSIPQ